MTRIASSGTKGRTGPGLALITGASAGIGAAFARAYARRGFDLALIARRVDRLEALAGRTERGPWDQRPPPSQPTWRRSRRHEQVLQALAERGLSVEVLVNNAGFGIPQRFADVAWTRQRDFLMTLVVNACGLAHGVIPDMVARGHGAIINVASVAGFAPGVAGNSLYPGAKSLMISFSQSLDAELRDKGLKITAVCPGSTRTEFGAAAGIQAVMDREPRMFRQSADAVVEAAIAGNAHGRVVVIPGWWNRLSVFLLRALPTALVRAVVGRAAAKYVPERGEG